MHTTELLKRHPYRAPYETKTEAQAWCDAMNAVHRDWFSVIDVPGGYGAIQDVRHGKQETEAQSG